MREVLQLLIVPLSLLLSDIHTFVAVRVREPVKALHTPPYLAKMSHRTLYIKLSGLRLACLDIQLYNGLWEIHNSIVVDYAKASRTLTAGNCVVFRIMVAALTLAHTKRTASLLAVNRVSIHA